MKKNPASNLLENFRENLFWEKTRAPDERILAAVSGGLDSVVLADLLKKTGIPFGIAHCNFQLRGDESDGDEAFVAALAGSFGVSFFSKHFDTQLFAVENSLSIQMAARDLRYAWFEEIRRENGFDRIATAHHLDDSVETSVFNFIRGTGIAGLTGIPPENGFVFRPLLFASRAEIEIYARENKIEWREDSSNATDDYSRNFIRHQIVPKMRELNPGLTETVARMQSRLQSLENNFRHLAKIVWQQISTEENGGYRIDKQALAKFSDPAAMLFEWLKNLEFSEEQTRQIAENLDARVGLELESPLGWKLLNDRKHLILMPLQPRFPPTKIQADDLMVSLPDGSKLFLMLAQPEKPYPDGKKTMLADLEKLSFPMTLRTWRPGDVFQPLGMDGQRQKLQDFFIDRKLTRLEKDQTWILENGSGEIVWVLGHRADERFKVGAETRNALKISWIT